MKRAGRHRKRSAPPGPCGVLWQAQRGRPAAANGGEDASAGGEENGGHSGLPAGHGEPGAGSNDTNKNKNNDNYGKNDDNNNDDDDDHHAPDGSTPHAWTAMQRSLGITTPYLPRSTAGNVRKRCELLRPHLPPGCVLLAEVLEGRHDLGLLARNESDAGGDAGGDAGENAATATRPLLFLCAWVDSIDETNAHHGIWTVVLRDETGATVRAWMEPGFCKRELREAQKQPEPQRDGTAPRDAHGVGGVVRNGVVWMLRDFSLTAVHPPSNTSGNTSGTTSHGGVERMLVVAGRHIARVWTPETDRHRPTEEDDSPRAQRGYLDWMERRRALVKEDDEDEKENENEGDGDGEEPETEHDGHQHPRGRSFSRSEPREPPPSRPDRRSNSCVDNDDERNKSNDDNHNHNNDDDTGRDPVVVFGGSEHREGMTAMSALTMTGIDATGTQPGGSQGEGFPAGEGASNGRPGPQSPGFATQRDESERFPSQRTSGSERRKKKKRRRRKHDNNNNKDNDDDESNRRAPARGGASDRRPHQRRNGQRGPADAAETKSPKRAEASVWNTPDPSVLELLLSEEAGERAEEEEREARTLVVGPSCTSSSLPATEEPLTHEDRGETPEAYGGRASAAALFEPSSWEGMDPDAFGEDDEEDGSDDG